MKVPFRLLAVPQLLQISQPAFHTMNLLAKILLVGLKMDRFADSTGEIGALKTS